jgi:RHS repeat-associated protein
MVLTDRDIGVRQCVELPHEELRSSAMQRIVALALSVMVPVGAAAQTETVTYYHIDAIGSVRMVTDADGQVVARYDYQPFGLSLDQMPPPPFERRQFAGKERDSETRFDYFGARYYASKSGRFTTVDPLLDIEQALVHPQRWNRYAYVGNNPLRKVDPTGGYEIDVHFHLTRTLARAAGIASPVADRIAATNQGIDETASTGPFGRRSARRDFHFTDAARRRELWDSFERSGSAEDLGVFFHAQQDSFAHEGYGPTFGHLLAGHIPDWTFAAPERADTMARDTFDRLRIAAQRLGGAGAIPWEVVRPFVTRFNRARTLEDKVRILDELRRAIDERTEQ